MRLAQHQQIAGLGDVLGRRPPMNPAAVWFAGDPAEFPDQRHDRVTGARETLVDAGAVEEFETGRPPDRRSRRIGDDAEFGLRLGQCRLDIEPSLPAVFLTIKRADTGVRYACRSRKFVTHMRILFLLACTYHFLSG